MKSSLRNLPAIILSLIVLNAGATVRYVNVNSANPAPPYTNWATAATTIQQAIDVALAGDEILVTNGVYQTGATAVYGMSNRVAVTKPVTVQSVNGPTVTQIKGYRVPGTTNGPAAVRCVFLSSGAVLAGFTLTNGATQTSGDLGTKGSGGAVWCGWWSAMVSNCVLTGNSASFGGGAYESTLINCTVTGNSATDGGGAYGCTLNNCTVAGNSASGEGGGAFYGTLNNCTVTGNLASYGGGTYYGTLNNCIVYYNRVTYSGSNYYDGMFNYCCTTPLPAGTGNVAEEPQLASPSRLSAGSPCIGRGSASNASGVDVDGEAWADPPSIGCDEYWTGSVTGTLSVVVVAAYTNVSVGYEVSFQAAIEGRVSASRWDFGEGVVVSNRPWASHVWVVPGDYVVELRAYNENYPAGVVATIAVHVVQAEHHVALNSTNPVSPYTSWATAARNIQDAVDAVTHPGAVVWVSNGVYQTGARAVYGMSNRVAVTKPVTVRSVNGPTVTQIKGYRVPGTTNGPAAVRCVYLSPGALLAGFTLTNGATQISGDLKRNQSGGGVWCEGWSAVVSNCVLTGNSADYYGGGAYYGTLNNCVLTRNSADLRGGGAYYGTLNNCTITSNSAGYGGGTYYGTVISCTLTGNIASSYGGGVYAGTMNNCILAGNSASSFGGGAFDAWLDNCILTGNSAQLYGGGAHGGTLNDCILNGNWATHSGGGADFATLNNCSLTGNSVYSTGCMGGGAASSTLNNCTLTGNSSRYTGGGAAYGTLNNCRLTGNWATYGGGGAFVGTLNNCTLTGNSASSVGGGSMESTLTNCIVYYNSSPDYPNYYKGTLRYCCTTPLPAGAANLANEPLFVVTNGWSNLRLQANSPCINAGNNASAPVPTDLDGNARIVGGTVDIGAYEFQTPASAISYAWLQQYGLPTDGTADFADSDGEGLNNWQEWRAGTVPTNALSALRMLSPSGGPTGITLSWESVNTRKYWLERVSGPSTQPVFSIIATNLLGKPGTTTYTDTNATITGPFFYRVGVQP
jgi:parallel beta-helix repeat protein